MTTARSYVLATDDAPAYWQIRNLWRVMATGIQTGGSFCALDQIVTDEGGGPPTHTHTQDEGLYVVSGHCTYFAGGEEISAGPGSFVSIPRLTEHSFNVDARGTQLLNFYLPAGFEMILIGLSVPAEENRLPPPTVPMPPPRLVEQLSAQYGMAEVLALPFRDPPDPDKMATRPTPGATVQPYGLAAADAPTFRYRGGLHAILAGGASTAGSYDLVEQRLPAGPTLPPHIHHEADEVIYVLDGTIEVFLGDRVETAGAGALSFIPKGTPHTFRVTSPEARLLDLHTPAGFAELARSLGVAADDDRGLQRTESADEEPGQLQGLLADLKTTIIDLVDPFERR